MKIRFSTLIFFLVLALQTNAQWIQKNSGTNKLLGTVYFINNNTGWAAGMDGTILKTTDGGETWFSQSISTPDNIRSIFFTDSLNGWIALYEWNPFRHGSVYHTTDGGNSWYSQLTVNDFGLLSLFFTDNLHGWVVGTQGILFRTTNGGNTWMNNFIADGWLYSERFVDNNIGWIVGDLFGHIAKTTNGGNSWIMQNVPFFYYLVDVFFIDQNMGWAVGFYGAILRTTNGGLNWLTQSSGLTNELRDVHFINENHGWIAGFGGKILHSSNGGNSWTQQNSSTGNDLYAVVFVDELTGWVVGDNGIILKTINGGVPVELISFEGIAEDGNVTLNWTTATELNNLGFEVERSNTNKEWRLIGFVEGKGTTTEIQNYSFHDDLFGITDQKLYYRLKQIDYNGNFEYSDEISVDALTLLSFALEQNYPNPFNPETKIQFTIPGNTFVKLYVFNSLGERVAIIAEEMKDAGYYEVEFNGINLPSGIYFYTLSTDKYTSTKKMILLK